MKSALLYSLLLSLSLLIGCSNKIDSSNIEIDIDDPSLVRTSVIVKYNKSLDKNIAKTKITNGLDIDPAKIDCYDKSDTSNKIDKFVVGDVLEVYYKDSSRKEIDHVYVDTVFTDAFRIEYIPAFPKRDLNCNLISDELNLQFILESPKEDRLLYALKDENKAALIQKNVQYGSDVYLAYRVTRDNRYQQESDIKAIYTYDPRN